MTTARIWSDFKDELLGFIRSRVNDSTIAEDLLQEVFVKIHSGIGSIHDESSLGSWVYRITRNTIIDYYRKKKLLVYQDSLGDKLPEELTDQPKDFSKCLNTFIRLLSDKEQDVLKQTAFGKKSQKEYALQVNESYSAVKSRVQRAREKLKARFVDCCAVEADKYGNVISAEKCNC